MARRRGRGRRRSTAGGMIGDAVYVGNRLPWWGAALMGLITFVIFYLAVPAWVHAQWDANPSQSAASVAIRQVLERRLHWFEYLGIGLGLVGAFFAIKNAFLVQRLGHTGERGVGFFSRLIARLLD